MTISNMPIEDFLKNCLIQVSHFKRRKDRVPFIADIFKSLNIDNYQNCLVEPILPSGQLLASFTNHNFTNIKAGLSIALTKAACMTRAIEANKPLFFLEDDAVLAPDFLTKLNEAILELPDDWKVFYLGWRDDHRPNEIPQDIKRLFQFDIGRFSKIKVLTYPWLNHALIIRCQKCLNDLRSYILDPATYRKPFMLASDRAIYRYLIENRIAMYGASPKLAVQAIGYSDHLEKEFNHNC